jgi:hypothetical protein
MDAACRADGAEDKWPQRRAGPRLITNFGNGALEKRISNKWCQIKDKH